MRLALATLGACLLLVVFSGDRSRVYAQPPQAGPIGRFQVFSSPSSPLAVILLDTQTGRSWLLCNTKSDSVASTKTIVDNNWCAMNVLGVATRP